jgi:hypothetical protein
VAARRYPERGIPPDRGPGDRGRGSVPDSRLRGAESFLFEERRHLPDGQALTEGDRSEIHVTAGDPVYDFNRRCGSIEPILACLQATASLAYPHGGAERQRVRHDTGGRKPIRHAGGAGPGRDLDEHLGIAEAAIRLPQ